MRRSILLLLPAAVCAVATFSATAWGTPSVSFKAHFVPIPKFSKTGNILGAGAAIQVEYQIAGTEYGGFPPPLIGLNQYLPEGAKVQTAGFPTCPQSTLEQDGPSGCSKTSRAGPVGNELGYVAFGSERVEESATIEPFYRPGGAFEVFADGHSPVSLEVVSDGRFVNLGGGGGFGPEMIIEAPLVSTVPGAPYASTKSLNYELGGAINKKAPTYFITLPTACPSGGFPIKTEAIFDREGANPPNPEVVTSTYDAPCPNGSLGGEPDVKKVQFKGGVGDPEIVIKGKNLGGEPPSPSYPPGSCFGSSTGKVFGESLYILDQSSGWEAGFGDLSGANCIGLEVTSWSKSKATLKFGSEYDAIPEWQLQPGDEYTLYLDETETSGTVLYKGKAKS